jgi:tetratricopeptide (TPR) repeat protein
MDVPAAPTSTPLFGSFRLTTAAKKTATRIMQSTARGLGWPGPATPAPAPATAPTPTASPYDGTSSVSGSVASPAPATAAAAVAAGLGDPFGAHQDGREKLQRHNDLEKKRRESMNDYITALHNLVPALHTVHRPSKSTILSKTIDYLRRLQHKAARLETTMTEAQNELVRLRGQNQLLLQLLTEHGVLPPDASADLSNASAAAAAGGPPSLMSPLPPLPSMPPPLWSSSSSSSSSMGASMRRVASGVAAATASTAGRATGYFAQDAGRVMLLVVALFVFVWAPWGVPDASTASAIGATSTVTATAAAGGRALLNEAADGALPLATDTTGAPRLPWLAWLPVLYWLAVRWVVMTSLLTAAMYWDTIYCSAAILDSLAKVRELNRRAEEAMSNGDYRRAKRCTEEALSLLRRPVPTSAFDLFIGNLYQGARQLAHRCVVGLVVERFLVFSRGQSAYAAELERAYLNLSQQNHCLPDYDKWSDLYVILCSVNLAEVVEGDRGPGLVQAYGALCYHVVVHTRMFEVFAHVYFSRAFDVVRRMGLHRSQFGQFYIIVAYRNLTQGRFREAFDNLQRGREMHRLFGLEHHYRECVLMSGWIEYVQGRQRESVATFSDLHESALADHDLYSQRWAMLGLVANHQHAGDYEGAAAWLERIARADREDPGAVNAHQELFTLGFTALQYLRQGLEDGALEVADRTLARMLETTRSGMPHNVLPMLGVAEVHLCLLEHRMRAARSTRPSARAAAATSGGDTDDEASDADGGGGGAPTAANAAAETARLIESVQKDLGLLRKFTGFFPVLASACHLVEGRVQLLLHRNEDRARDAFRRAIDSARSFHMRYQEACALFEMGRLLPVRHPQRLAYLDGALKLFAEMDAAYDERLTLNEIQTHRTPRLFAFRPTSLA